MRVTIRIDEELHSASKVVAAEMGLTLGQLVENALRQQLDRRANACREPVVLPTSSGGRLMQGVDLSNSADLLDLMDEEDLERYRPRNR